jgi:hypothetical protein
MLSSFGGSGNEYALLLNQYFFDFPIAQLGLYVSIVLIVLAYSIDFLKVYISVGI